MSAKTTHSYCSSTTAVTDNVIGVSSDTLTTTLSSPGRAGRIDELGKLASSLEAFVQGYQRIVDPEIDTDDEIFNWTFGEAPADFAAAIWLLASGYYKASVSCLRNAYEISMVALYFQVRENTKKNVGYNKFFAEWDRGDRDTPNWGEMKDYIAKQKTVEEFVARIGIDPIAVVYDHFKYLCAYTHTSAFAGVDDPVTAINMTGIAPAFDEQFFTRGSELTIKTIALIAILWQIVYPGILKTEPLGPVAGGAYDMLFSAPLGAFVLRV